MVCLLKKGVLRFFLFQMSFEGSHATVYLPHQLKMCKK